MVLATLLGAIAEADGKRRDVALSRVASHANVPYGRMAGYLSELEKAGLVSNEAKALTPRGREFLTHYRQWHETLQRFGLE